MVFSHSQQNVNDVSQARKLIFRYGKNAVAAQILNPGIQLWFSADREAVAGYRRVKGTWVIAGQPICAPERMETVSADLEETARRQGFRVCYFYVEKSFAASFRKKTNKHLPLLMGAQPVWNPKDWPEVYGRHRGLRRAVRQAQDRGVKIELWSSERAAADERFLHCSKQWQQARGLPTMKFLVEPENLGSLSERRVFAASAEREVCGFLTLTPVPVRNGWLIEHTIRGLKAPRGTVELLLHTAMLHLRNEGASYVTLGLAPLSRKAGLSYTGNPRWARFLFSLLWNYANRFYNFRGIDAFKARFRPHSWEPVYAVAEQRSSGFGGLYAAAGAFFQMSPVLFTLCALFRLFGAGD